LKKVHLVICLSLIGYRDFPIGLWFGPSRYRAIGLSMIGLSAIGTVDDRAVGRNGAIRTADPASRRVCGPLRATSDNPIADSAITDSAITDGPIIDSPITDSSIIDNQWPVSTMARTIARWGNRDSQ